MSIETLIQDLTTALEANTAALKAGGGKIAAKKATTKKATTKKATPESVDEEDDLLDDTPSGPTREQVKTALKDYAALEGKASAIKILKDNGAASIGELEEDKFQAVIDATS